jgi:hypothetical protein
MRRNGKQKDVFGIGNMTIRRVDPVRNGRPEFIASMFFAGLGAGFAKRISRAQALAAIKEAERFALDARRAVAPGFPWGEIRVPKRAQKRARRRRRNGRPATPRPG